ncbi:DUF2569 domain-containing protein [Stenotrophomonas sp. HITSZ_GD]|uniref:DUF2569 domain-containing protein n=1 Tax=Stenotrophomonas sp. HITSZ_GD TaxID=3037248 RepID=UPI00240D4FB2|nr:DUF2569 domain-containing protein [Stenotrophomonas sp. HITSZ_GD]MDG2524422.1 DUF2569 domain-containing protein [Stenotrophomonas sp. HITSZ_GD]
MNAGKNGPEGLGGWLALVIIGLCFSLVRIPWTIATDLMPVLSNGTLAQLTDPQGAAYHPLWLPLIVFEFAANFFMIALTAATLTLMLARSRYTPVLAITLYASSVAIVSLDLMACNLIPALAEQPVDGESLRELGRSLVVALIWIPYFLVSKRVRATFVRRWPALPGRTAAPAIPPLPPR